MHQPNSENASNMVESLHIQHRIVMHWPNSENASNTVESLHIQHRIIMHWPNSENASNMVELLHIQHRIVTNPQYLRGMLRIVIFLHQNLLHSIKHSQTSVCAPKTE